MATSPTVKDTLERVKTRLAELRKRSSKPRTGAPDDAATMTWPHDLNADGEVATGSWGADSAEGA